MLMVMVAGFTAERSQGSFLRYVVLAWLLIALVALSVQGVREWEAEQRKREEELR